MSKTILLLCKTLIQRGKILESKLRQLGINLTKLSDKLPWTVKTIYRHFEENELPYEKIAEYAKAVKYPFTEEFPELEKFNYNSIDEIPIYKESTEPDYYRLKYEMLLEKYNGLLEKHNEVIVKFLSRGNDDADRLYKP